MRREFPITFRKTIPIEFFPEPVEVVRGEMLEIGPGRGDFLFDMAAQSPNASIVAVEIAGKRFRKLVARVIRRQAQNVFLIRGDARVVLERHCESKTFASIFVLFPDPWPKNRHAYHRLLTAPMLTLLASLLRPGGSIYLATDDQQYFHWAVGNCRHVTSLSYANEPEPHICPIPGYRPTYFETKWRNDGRTIWYARFSRVSSVESCPSN